MNMEERVRSWESRVDMRAAKAAVRTIASRIWGRSGKGVPNCGTAR